MADLYPFYARLRAEDPVHRSPLGFWVHFCLGAPLARLEAQVAIGTVVRRIPALALATAAPEFREGGVLRGLRELPVIFE